MEFKYFKYPEQYAVMTDPDVACELCGNTQRCFDGELFFGKEEISAICVDCLQAGRLRGRELSTNQGDVEELIHQVTLLNPHLEAQEIEEMVQTKVFELEQATPHLLMWQDWDWPCADGDFCQFIQYGSKEDFNQLARDGDGKQLFAETLYEDLKAITDIDDIWESLPDKRIQRLEDSEYDTLCYIFRSLYSDKIVTIWDCN